MFLIFFFQPIDVVKTRLQVQGELGKTQITKYNGFGGGLMTIIKNESIGGLYKGIGASLLREGIYSTIRLGGYGTIEKKRYSQLFSQK